MGPRGPFRCSFLRAWRFVLSMTHFCSLQMPFNLRGERDYQIGLMRAMRVGQTCVFGRLMPQRAAAPR